MSEDGLIQRFPQDHKEIVKLLQRTRRPGPVLLADCSGSMARLDGGPLRRIERLAQVLANLLGRVRLEALIAFSDHVREIPLVGRISLPSPSGGTALHLALDYVADLTPMPTRLFVLSDGVPDWPDNALDVARRRIHPMPIEAFYIGPDEDERALRFMRDLASCGGPGSSWGHYDLKQPELIAEDIRLRIAHSQGG